MFHKILTDRYEHLTKRHVDNFLTSGGRKKPYLLSENIIIV